MLSKDTISSLASVLGVSAEDITAKLTSDKEESLNIPQGQFYSEDELSDRDKNKYDEAKVVFEEKTVKDIKRELGYDFENKHNSFNHLFKVHDEALKNKYQKDVSDREKELLKDLETVNKNNEETVSSLQSKLESLQTQNKMNGLKADLLGIVPSETLIPKDDLITLFLTKHQVKDTEDGKMYLEKDGTPLKDPKTQSYLDYKNVFSEFSEGYKAKPSGRGEGNQNGSQKVSNADQFIDNWTKQNDKPISSPDGVKALMAYQSENSE